MNKKALLYYIGLGLISLSFIICVISFYLFYFLWPVFIIGVILLFFSNKKLSTIFLTLLVPLLLYYPSVLLFLYFYNHSSAKTMLIPSELEGRLRIVYEEKCGGKYVIQDGVETLIFPKNGVLILNEEFDNHINYNYFLVDQNGNKTKIQATISKNNEELKTPRIECIGSGTISNSTEDETFQYTDFYLYNKDTTTNNSLTMESAFDSLTSEEVRKCRNQKR